MPDILAQTKATETADAAGTVSTAWRAVQPDNVPDLSGGIIPANVITFPAGLGDDPRQPFFMTFVPKKITSSVGGTFSDQTFAAVTIIIRVFFLNYRIRFTFCENFIFPQKLMKSFGSFLNGILHLLYSWFI